MSDVLDAIPPEARAVIVDELTRERTALVERPDSQVAEMTKPADAHALMHAIKEKQTDS